VAIQLQFNPKADIDLLKLINLLQRDKRCRMNGPEKLRIAVALGHIHHRVELIKDILKQFENK
jgi:transcription-repair coupling factor (superfamily II helicase)